MKELAPIEWTEPLRGRDYADVLWQCAYRAGDIVGDTVITGVSIRAADPRYVEGWFRMKKVPMVRITASRSPAPPGPPTISPFGIFGMASGWQMEVIGHV